MRRPTKSPALTTALALCALGGCGAAFNVEVKGATPPATAAATATAAVTAEARVVVSQVIGLTVRAAGQAGRAQTVHGGALAIESTAGIGPADVLGGDLEIDAGAVSGAPCNVRGGSLRLAGGAELQVTGGRVTLGEDREGRWVLSSGRVTAAARGDASATNHLGASAPAGAAANASASVNAAVTADGSATNGSVPTGNASVTNGAAGAVRPAALGAQGASPSATSTTATAMGGAAGAAAGATGAAAGATSGAAGATGGAAGAAGASVERVAACGGAHVIAGGRVTLNGLPPGDFTVVDGAVDFDDPELAPTAGGSSARRAVRPTERRTLRVRPGGTLLVSDRQGRRCRARVEGGEIVARTEGSNPSGRVVWQPTGGAVQVRVVATGGAGLTLTGDGLPETTVDFSPRVRAALDTLVAAATPGSAEAARLAAAVQVVLRQAESTEPAFYAIPVRGRSLVVMIDISYSMSDPDPNGAGFATTPSKLDVARAELVKVLASIPPNVTVNAIAFSSQVNRLWDGLRPMDDVALRAAIQWAAALRPADETHPLEAIDAAAVMSPEQIVFLSDGRPSSSDAVLRGLLARVEGLSARTRVDVVGFGADQDRTFLAALAARGRGTLRLR
jgi:hypothetical protein